MENSRGTLQMYLNDIRKYPLIDHEREKKLAKKARNGDNEAIKELINANLRFVIYTAKKYQKGGIPLSDLISAGNMGLIKAANKYDERYEAKFLSYAVWWIKRYINRFIAEYSKSFRIPSTRAREVFKVKKAMEKINSKKGREPTAKEIAEEIEHSISIKQIEENIKLAKKDVSLNELVDNSGELEFKDIIPKDTEDLMNKYDQECLVNKILEKLNQLEPRSKKIIFYYFGLNKNNPYTLEEIGKVMHISRERVRQLRDKGLEEIKKWLMQQGIIDSEAIKTKYLKDPE
jgi:RNA polymerase primary sigma factor